jgi:GR25 family glycosyltransferase involved in LPS biosynthesis
MKIDKIFIINLEERFDRKNEMVKELEKAGITNYEFFKAIRPTSQEDIDRWNPNFVTERPKWLKTDLQKYRLGSLGCLLSHVGVMKLSLQRNYNRILILEDDVSFIRFAKGEKFEGTLDVIDEQIGSNNVDILYLGGNHNPNRLKHVHNDIYRTFGTLTTQSYVLTSSIMERIVKEIKCCDKEIDVFYLSIQRKDLCYAIIPSITTQRPSYSDIVQTHVAYNLDRL